MSEKLRPRAVASSIVSQVKFFKMDLIAVVIAGVFELTVAVVDLTQVVWTKVEHCSAEGQAVSRCKWALVLGQIVFFFPTFFSILSAPREHKECRSDKVGSGVGHFGIRRGQPEKRDWGLPCG